MARGSGKRIVVLLALVLAVFVELAVWIALSWRDAARGIGPSTVTSAWATATWVTAPFLLLFVAWLLFGRRARG